MIIEVTEVTKINIKMLELMASNSNCTFYICCKYKYKFIYNKNYMNEEIQIIKMEFIIFKCKPLNF